MNINTVIPGVFIIIIRSNINNDNNYINNCSSISIEELLITSGIILFIAYIIVITNNDKYN